MSKTHSYPVTGPASDFFRAAPASASSTLHLQAIFYNPAGHSTAVINGKTLSVGDRFDSYTVQAISQQSVTLQSADGRKTAFDFRGH